MSAIKSASGSLIDLASAWATQEGFTSLADVPPSRANELVGALIASTRAPRSEVVAALLSSWQDALAEARPDKRNLMGGSASTTAHTPLKGAGMLRPVAAQIEAQMANKAGSVPSFIDELANTDRMVRQTLQDLARTRIAVTDKASGRVLDVLHHTGLSLLARVRELSARPDDAQVKEEIVSIYQDLLSRLARDRGVFLVKDDVPRARLAPLGAAVPASGLSPLQVRAMAHDKLVAGRPLELGQSAMLGVDASGKQAIVEVRGEVREILSIEEFVGRREAAQKKSRGQSQSINAESLRSLSDDELSRLGKKVTFVALKSGDPDPLARIYATKWVRPQGSFVRRRVISEGPWRGIFLDDLANRMATLRGAAFRYDASKRARIEVKAKEGEPLVSTATVRQRGQNVERLYVRLPFEASTTEIRRALRRLSELDPNVVYVRDSKNTAFYFPPECYGAVRDVLRTMVLDESALGVLEAHFGELKRKEAALAPTKVEEHSAEAIGGFRRSVVAPDGSLRPFELNSAQKEGLSWLAARDYRGVIALGTGVGKTLLSIGALLELKKRAHESRPFLVVTPPALRGNFAKEVYRYLDKSEAEALLAQTVVLSYPQFQKAVREGKLDGKKFAAERFGAVVFDEAQALNNPGSSRARAALSFKHPRTLCLSASPIEKSPMDAYVMACVAQGIDLNDRKEGREHRWRMRKFKELVCETLGGRILGVKDEIELMPGVKMDPKQGLYTWVRQNLFYADKRDDKSLPDLHERTTALPMRKDMEREYRKRARRVAKVLRGMVSLYRDKGVGGQYVDKKGRTRDKIHPLARDPRLGRVFGPKFKAAIASLNEVSNNEAKTARAAELLWSHLADEPKSRAVLFSDSASYVLEAAKKLSSEIPAKLHAACLAGEIRVFKNGVELTELHGHALPLSEREYQGKERVYAAHEWQQFVLGELLKDDPEVTTATLFAPVYQTGQNLQWANVGFHLDRDTWNSENMKQREARLWRQGQTREVTIHNLDWVFKKPEDGFDRTLDEIRGYVEEIGEALFRDLIEVPQRSVKLGSEWNDVRSESALRFDLHLLRLGVAPTLERLAQEGRA